MGRVARKRMHHSERHNQRKFRTRARTADLDQILEQKEEGKTGQLFNLGTEEPDAHDLPGSGEFYCQDCSRYFIAQVFLLRF
jgi:hypothetical protein